MESSGNLRMITDVRDYLWNDAIINKRKLTITALHKDGDQLIRLVWFDENGDSAMAIRYWIGHDEEGVPHYSAMGNFITRISLDEFLEWIDAYSD